MCVLFIRAVRASPINCLRCVHTLSSVIKYSSLNQAERCVRRGCIIFACRLRRRAVALEVGGRCINNVNRAPDINVESLLCLRETEGKRRRDARGRHERVVARKICMRYYSDRASSLLHSARAHRRRSAEVTVILLTPHTRSFFKPYPKTHRENAEAGHFIPRLMRTRLRAGASLLFETAMAKRSAHDRWEIIRPHRG